MSSFKLQQPVTHIPSFDEYEITGHSLKSKLKALGLEVPLEMLDYTYYHTDLEGWGKILYDLVLKSSLYKTDRFDCENYALRVMNLCAERYGLNAMGLVIGDMSLGRHGFNIFYCGDDHFMLFEPNEGFGYDGEAFEIGGHGYQPNLVLI